MGSSRFRRLTLAFHLWSGLLLGSWLVLLGLTGSALVFYVDIEQSLAQSQVAQQAASPPRASAIEAALRQHFPRYDGPWRIELPMSPAEPINARYYGTPERKGQHFAPFLVSLDPSTLVLREARFWGDTPMTWIYNLHFTLLLGKGGATAVGIIGLLNVAVLLAGIYLWWPSPQRWWSGLRILPRSGTVKRAYDLHCTGGVYGLLLLLLLLLTGSALAFPDQTRALLGAAPAASAPALPAAPPAPQALDEAVHQAQLAFPHADLRWIETSGARGTPIMLRMHQPFEPSQRFPQTRSWHDPRSGRLLRSSDPAQAGIAQQITHWMHPLHNGEAFGQVGRWVVFACGFLPLLLFVTGVIRWRHKLTARATVQFQRKLSQAPAAAATPASRTI
ncbi:PepSY-associated TM helix domain-containing protein [Massilia sp. SR12]